MRFFPEKLEKSQLKSGLRRGSLRGVLRFRSMGFARPAPLRGAADSIAPRKPPGQERIDEGSKARTIERTKGTCMGWMMGRRIDRSIDRSKDVTTENQVRERRYRGSAKPGDDTSKISCRGVNFDQKSIPRASRIVPKWLPGEAKWPPQVPKWSPWSDKNT